MKKDTCNMCAEAGHYWMKTGEVWLCDECAAEYASICATCQEYDFADLFYTDDEGDHLCGACYDQLLDMVDAMGDDNDDGE